MPSPSPWQKLPSWVNHTGHYFILTDTHGRIDEFRLLLGRQPAGSQLVHLGDIGDRGPDSIACYRELDARPDAILIRGNHEAFLDTCIFRPVDGCFQAGLTWLWQRNGGNAFLKQLKTDSAEKIDLLQRILDRQMPAHVEGNLVFCHSGLYHTDDFQKALTLKTFTEEDWVSLQENGRLPSFIWGIGEEIFTYPEVDSWNGIDFKPFLIHGHCRASDSVPGRPRVCSWHIDVDWLYGLAALEIKDGAFRFYDQPGL